MLKDKLGRYDIFLKNQEVITKLKFRFQEVNKTLSQEVAWIRCQMGTETDGPEVQSGFWCQLRLGLVLPRQLEFRAVKGKSHGL